MSVLPSPNPIINRKFSVSAAAGQFSHDVSHKSLGFPEEHQGFIEVVERVVDSREARVHAALDHHYGWRFVHVEARHADAQRLP